MRRRLKLKRLTAFVTSLALLASQLAFPPRTEASHLGSSTASAGSAPSPAVTAIQSFQPDLFTGRATTAMPIAVPPGRKGMQPSLGLTYSSSGRNGWVGVGWGLDAGYIERSTKNGVPKYDTTDTYAFMFQGVSSDLVKIPDGTYRAKDEGLFLRFEYKGVSGWEVRDKSGTRYLFGQAVASQIEDNGKIFRWALDKILDTNGNSLSITYAKDQGQLYPVQIRYTAHEATGLAPTNQVDFILEDRPDHDLSVRAGFGVRTAKRLKQLEARATTNGALSLARRYTFTYAQSARTGRSLLSSMTQFGTDGTTSVPPMTFSYQDAGATTYSASTNNPTISAAAWNVRKTSVDTGHETYGCEHPYRAFPWSSPVVVTGSTDLGCMSAAVSANGSVRLQGCQDTYGHALTYVYASSARTISLPLATGSDTEFCMWREDASGVQRMTSSSVSLQAGWSILHVVAYHQHQGWGPAWINASVIDQVDAMSPSQFIKPQLAGDVDGNGITDLIAFNAVSGTWTVSCSQSCTFSPGGTWLSGFGNTSSIPVLGDWNADGRTDIAIVNGSSWEFATSTGTSFQRGTVASLSLGSGTPMTGDFNGDGMIDVGIYSSGSWTIALATGSGFTSQGTWLSASADVPLTGDFNGDGLTDVAGYDKANGSAWVALAKGNGLLAPASWLPANGSWSNWSPTSADVNGDGLSDLLHYDRSNGQVRTLLSIGTALASPPGTLPITFSRRSVDDGLQVGDFNGDGLADPAVVNGVTGAAELAKSQGTFPDLMSTITNGVGGSTAIQYQPSTQCDNICPIEQLPMLPFILPVVNRVTVSDGMGNSYASTYLYQQGRYDVPSREFRGFAHVEARDPDSQVTLTEFHQDEHKKGRPFRTEFHDASGNLWTKQEQAWSCVESFPGVHFTKLDQADAFTYDGDATFRQTRSRITYDVFGNLTRADDDGEPSVSGDERSTLTSYALNQTAWILNKPSLVQTLDAQGAVIAQRRFYYDGATTVGTAPSAGKLTKEEEWLNLPTTQWLATILTYDVYGNVKTVTDARSRTTTNTYDSTGAYLTQIANALGHTRKLAYDPRLGQVTSSTDQNNVLVSTEYDPLGRVSKVIGPNDTASLPTMRYAYDLSIVPTRTTVHTRIQSGQSAELSVHSFSDGLGRAIQTRTPAEDPNKQVVSGAVEWNSRGLVAKQWAPYLDALLSGYKSHTQVSGLAAPATYSYDPLGRLVSSRDPDGATASTAYDDWSVTATDANGHRTRRTQDAHGRLAQVDEFSGANTQTTRYAYDTLGNLLTVTDAANNLTRISYDSLSRKLAMDDPDMGHWAYVYDTVDNLTKQTDARGVATNFVYDSLNRLTQKSYTVPAGITNPGAVTYTYDGTNDTTKPFTKGKLTKVADGSGSATFEYDNLGRLTKEAKTIDGITYVIQRAYDLLGRLTSLTYPDSDRANYTYNLQGGIDTVTLQPATGSAQPIVSNIDYNAAGQLTKITHGNGVVTDYTYNPQTLRLDRLASAGPSGSLQDFRYTFDAVGNVTGIQDSLHTGSQTFGYDDLNRLTSASGAYGNMTYAYDALGNLTNKEGVGMTYGLAGGAKPHAVISTSDGLTLSYDANGNLTQKSPSASSPHLAQTLKYDAENRLEEVKTTPGTTYTFTFKPGWNFFSLPVIPSNRSISVLFPNFTTNFEVIARALPPGADPSAPTTFEYYVGNSKFDKFTQLDYGTGYQIYCKATSPVTVTITGALPTTQLSKSLAPGWHLLPAVSLMPTDTAQVFASVSPARIEGYDSDTDSLAAAPTTELGRAYFVQVPSTKTWTPPLPSQVTTRWIYDGDGGKVKQIAGSATTILLGEIYEKESTGQITKYLFAGSLRLATKRSTGELLFTHTDHLGSSHCLTDAAGTPVALTEHLPYGAMHRSEGAKSLPHKFTGQRQDATHDLILFPARAYDPQLGRFLQPDPFVQEPSDPQSLNRYSYVRNNPVNLVDPTGFKWSWKKFFAIAAAVVVGVVTGQLELPGIVAAAFSAATVAAATVEGVPIDRALARSTSQLSPIAVVAQQSWQVWSNFATQPVVAQGASIVAGLLPFVGEAQDAVGAGTGIDMISGDRLAPWEQAASGAVLFVPFFGGVHVRHGVRALNKVIQSNQTSPLRRAFRYFGKSEAEIVQKSGRVPNVTKEGRLKEVLLTPTEYRSSRQAEEALRAGQLNPRGPLEKLEYGVEVELEGVRLRRANAIEGGSDIEVGTYGSPRVRRIFKLDE